MEEDDRDYGECSEPIDFRAVTRVLAPSYLSDADLPTTTRQPTLEEAMLQEEFGEQYESYRQKTKKLVSFGY